MIVSKKVTYLTISDDLDTIIPVEAYCFKENGLSGVKSDSSIIIPAIYDKTIIIQERKHHDFFYVLVVKDNLMGLLDLNNEVLVSPKYDRIHKIYSGCVIVSRNGFYGVVKFGDEILIPLKYESIHGIYEDYVCVSKNGFKGIAQFGDNSIEECVYDDIKLRKGTFILIKGKEKWLVDYKLKIPKITFNEYDDCDGFSSFYSSEYVATDFLKNPYFDNKYFSRIYKDGLTGLITNEGHVLIKPYYKTIGLFKPGKFFEEKLKLSFFPEICYYGKSFGGPYENLIYETLWNEPFVSIETFEGLCAPVDIRGYFYGIIPPIYQIAVMELPHRFLAMNNKKKLGVIDDNNNILCPFIFDNCILPDRNGKSGTLSQKDPFLIMEKHNQMCIVNVQTGRIQTSYYDKIYWMSSLAGQICLVCTDGKLGVMDINENVILPIIYDSLSEIHYDGKECNVGYAMLNGEHGTIKKSVFISDEEAKRFRALDNKRNMTSVEWTRPTYDKYAGTYAQDEMGYSDDDIDTIFDGDPDAYWNID